MLNQISKLLLFALLFAVIAIFSPANAAHSSNLDVPEKNGDFPDPDHPGIRVRVFVHEPKIHKNALPQAPLACTDPDANDVVSAAGWELPQGAWTYRLNLSNLPVGINLPTIASNGFADWTAAQNDVTFVRVADTSVNRNKYDGQNIIAWGQVSGRALGVTYVRYYTSNGNVVDVDTIMNRRVAWSWTNYEPNSCGPVNTYDAEAVLTHELGHWLGLDDEYTSNYVDHTMYGYGTPGELKPDTLTTGDRAGTAAIYE